MLQLCPFCDNPLKTRYQRKLGYCSTAHSLKHLHFKADLILQQLEAEEKEFENISFQATELADGPENAPMRNYLSLLEKEFSEPEGPIRIQNEIHGVNESDQLFTPGNE